MSPLSLFILLYPSVPFFSLGWGSNIPFFIASCLYNLQELRKFNRSAIDPRLYLLLLSIPALIVAFLILKSEFPGVNWTTPLLGIRELVTNFSILLSIFFITRKCPPSLLWKVLILGLLINFGYGFLEIVIHGFSKDDRILHEATKDSLYLVNEENTRIRLLWNTPTMAATYLIFMLPLVLMTKQALHRILLIVLWLGAFVKVGSKGSLFFLILGLVLYVIVRPISASKFILRNFVYLLGSLIIATALMVFLESEFLDTVALVWDILIKFWEINPIYNGFNEFIHQLPSSGIKDSNYLRFIINMMAVENFLREPYAILTGFSPGGAKFYYALNPDLVFELPAIAHFATRFSYEEMSMARPIVESSLLDPWVSFGLPMAAFILISFVQSFRSFKALVPHYPELIFFYFLWLGLCTSMMYCMNAYALIYVMAIVSKRFLEAYQARRGSSLAVATDTYEETRPSPVKDHGHTQPI